MYAFNSAAIFPPGHPYIESTTVLSDNHQNFHLSSCQVKFELVGETGRRNRIDPLQLTSHHAHVTAAAILVYQL